MDPERAFIVSPNGYTHKIPYKKYLALRKGSIGWDLPVPKTPSNPPPKSRLVKIRLIASQAFQDYMREPTPRDWFKPEQFTTKLKAELVKTYLVENAGSEVEEAIRSTRVKVFEHFCRLSDRSNADFLNESDQFQEFMALPHPQNWFTESYIYTPQDKIESALSVFEGRSADVDSAVSIARTKCETIWDHACQIHRGKIETFLPSHSSNSRVFCYDKTGRPWDMRGPKVEREATPKSIAEANLLESEEFQSFMREPVPQDWFKLTELYSRKKRAFLCRKYLLENSKYDIAGAIDYARGVLAKANKEIMAGGAGESSVRYVEIQLITSDIFQQYMRQPIPKNWATEEEVFSVRDKAHLARDYLVGYNEIPDYLIVKAIEYSKEACQQKITMLED